MTVELPWLREKGFRCFGCSPDNPVGLALRMHRLPDDALGARVTFSEDYASYPGVVHGGIVAVLVDELMGDMIALDRGLLSFTVTLRVKNLMPVRTGVPHTAVARYCGEGDGIIRTEADVLGEDGEPCAMASGTYQPIRSAQAQELMTMTGPEHLRMRHYFDHEIG